MVLKVARLDSRGPIAAEGRKCPRNGDGEEGTAKRCHGADRGNLCDITIQKEVMIPSFVDKSSMPLYLQCFTGGNHEIIKSFLFFENEKSVFTMFLLGEYNSLGM